MDKWTAPLFHKILNFSVIISALNSQNPLYFYANFSKCFYYYDNGKLIENKGRNWTELEKLIQFYLVLDPPKFLCLSSKRKKALKKKMKKGCIQVELSKRLQIETFSNTDLIYQIPFYYQILLFSVKVHTVMKFFSIMDFLYTE